MVTERNDVMNFRLPVAQQTGNYARSQGYGVPQFNPNTVGLQADAYGQVPGQQDPIIQQMELMSEIEEDQDLKKLYKRTISLDKKIKDGISPRNSAFGTLAKNFTDFDKNIQNNDTRQHLKDRKNILNRLYQAINSNLPLYLSSWQKSFQAENNLNPAEDPSDETRIAPEIRELRSIVEKAIETGKTTYANDPRFGFLKNVNRTNWHLYMNNGLLMSLVTKELENETTKTQEHLEKRRFYKDNLPVLGNLADFGIDGLFAAQAWGWGGRALYQHGRKIPAMIKNLPLLKGLKFPGMKAIAKGAFGKYGFIAMLGVQGIAWASSEGYINLESVGKVAKGGLNIFKSFMIDPFLRLAVNKE